MVKGMKAVPMAMKKKAMKAKMRSVKRKKLKKNGWLVLPKPNWSIKMTFS